MVARPKDKAEKEALKCYENALRKLRGAGERISWWDWWFNSESWLRRVLGGFLMVAVIACIAAPFIPEGRCGWFNCGQSWGTYIVPAAVSLLLLLLPVLRSFGTQGVELSPQLSEHELERDIMEKYLKPKLD